MKARADRFRLAALAAAIVACFVFAAPSAPGVSPLLAASQCEWDNVERIVAVGDVHGAYDQYLEILKTAGVIDAGGRWSGGKTHFVQLGDIVDRGADSRKALDFNRRLEREAQAAGGHAHLLLGNHEVARMLGDLRLTVPGEYAAFSTADSVKRRDQYLKTLKFASDAE